LTISAGVGDGVASTIFIVHESLQDGFDLLLTVIVTVPTFFAVTTPEELTLLWMYRWNSIPVFYPKHLSDL